MIRASAWRPCCFAHSSEASTSAPAPSFTPGALPAVCEPSFTNCGGSFASASSEVSRRGASSISTTLSPFFDLTVDGHDLLGEAALVGRLDRELVAAQRPLVHVRPRQLELGRDLARLLHHVLAR